MSDVGWECIKIIALALITTIGGIATAYIYARYKITPRGNGKSNGDTADSNFLATYGVKKKEGKK